jgi:hypothetical protein
MLPGNAIAPGAIAADSTKEFVDYFAASNLGGIFLLNAVFAVTGDASQIHSLEVQLINSSGTTKSGRISF